ncbi:MAG: helix-turn-helix transcriptional regulator [Ignavibacteria bacterium]|nr:helix-turn-helix transcriptional regulator [Ignavibacteria bacterium]
MAKIKSKSVGEVIKQYRILKDITQEKLAETLKISYQTVQKYEYNKIVPPLSKLAQIAKILEIPSEAFFKENARQDLLDRIETYLSKNYEFAKILKENHELQEIIRFYLKHKANLKASDILKFMKVISNVPNDKKAIFLNTIYRVVNLTK